MSEQATQLQTWIEARGLHRPRWWQAWRKFLGLRP